MLNARAAAVVGVLLVTLAAGEARASAPIAAPGGDPVAADADLVWNQPGVGGFLLRNGQRIQLPGTDPAVGGPYIAWRNGDAVTVAAADSLQPVFQLSLPGAEKLGVSERWLVFRARLPSGKEQLRALSFTDPATVRAISHARARGRLGRPSLGHNTVVYHLVNPGGSELFSLDLLSGKRRLLRSSRRDLLLNPARVGSRLLYERVGRCGQELRLGPLDGTGSRPHALPAPAARRPGRGPRSGPHGAGPAAALPPPAEADEADALDDRAHAHNRVRDGPPPRGGRPHDAVAARGLPLTGVDSPRADLARVHGQAPRRAAPTACLRAST